MPSLLRKSPELLEPLVDKCCFVAGKFSLEQKKRVRENLDNQEAVERRALEDRLDRLFPDN